MPRITAPLLCTALALTMMTSACFAMSNDQVTETVASFLRERTHTLPGTVNISVVALNEKQHTLAACAQAQAFLPQGQKAWGRVTVGVRCMSGPNASLYVSARVRVDGSYVALARAVAGGQPLDNGDVVMAQGELTAHPDDLILTLNDAIGQASRQALSPGQPLRGAYLQHEISIQAGQSVRVLARGGGFAVVNQGRALNSATRGAITRVKLENGQIVSGIAGEAGVVDVSGP